MPGSQPRPGSIVARSTAHRGETRRNRAHFAAWTRRNFLSFYDFPAEHRRHLRTTNIIESPFATVRLRQRVTKGAGSRMKALMMAFKLLAMAEERWRKVNGSELLPLVRAGVRFVGVQEKAKNTGVSGGMRSEVPRETVEPSNLCRDVRRSWFCVLCLGSPFCSTASFTLVPELGGLRPAMSESPRGRCKPDGPPHIWHASGRSKLCTTGAWPQA